MEASLRLGHLLLCTLPNFGRHLGLSCKIFLFFIKGRAKGNLLPLTLGCAGKRVGALWFVHRVV